MPCYNLIKEIKCRSNRKASILLLIKYRYNSNLNFKVYTQPAYSQEKTFKKIKHF